MSRLAEIISAVVAAIGRLVGRTVRSMRWVGGKATEIFATVYDYIVDTAAPAIGNCVFGGVMATPSLVARGVWSAAKESPRMALEAAKIGIGVTAGVLKIAGGAVSDVMKMPFRFLGMVLGGGGTGGSPQADQQEAVAQEEMEQNRCDRRDEARQMITALRRVASARARGEAPDAESLGRLPERVAAYVLALSADECAVMARRTTMALRGVLQGRGVDGVRSPRDLEDARQAQHMSVTAVSARKAEIPGAVRDALRNRARSAGDVIREMGMA